MPAWPRSLGSGLQMSEHKVTRGALEGQKVFPSAPFN